MALPRRQQTPKDRAELDQIVAMLRARIFDLVRGPWDLRDGWREGHDWVCRNPLRGDHTAKSFRVTLGGPYQGMVKDFAGPFIAGKDTVSPMTFHAHLMHNGDMGAAVKWAKAWLGLDGCSPDALRSSHKALQAFDDRSDADPALVDKKRRRAKAIYLSGQADITGTPVDEYLEGRGIDLRRLDFPLRCLRFHPRLYCAELGPHDDERAYLPAMVAPISGMDGAMLGVHRTWLERTPAGKWIKRTGLKNAKKTFGPYQGGVIRLWNGARIDPKTGEFLYGRALGEVKEPCEIDITEGIEDGLSVVMACPDARVCAGVSLSNMVGLAFPEIVTGVRFWKQNDAADSAAARQFERAVDNTWRQGKAVRIVEIPTEWKDPNEVLQASNGEPGSPGGNQ